MLIRAINRQDADDVMRLAEQAGTGMTLLPDEKVIAKKIKASMASFSEREPNLERRQHLMVTEDNNGKIVGISGIYPDVGYFPAFVKNRNHLSMSHHLSGKTEVGTLFVMPDARRMIVEDSESVSTGRTTSLARFVLMAVKPKWFSPIIFAEIRGYQDERGNNLYYDRVWQDELRLPYEQADGRLLSHGHHYLSKYTPYDGVELKDWSLEDQGLIAKPHEVSAKAAKILCDIGFTTPSRSCDILGGGPHYVCKRTQIETVQATKAFRAAATGDKLDNSESLYLIGTGVAKDFRMVVARARTYADRVIVHRGALEQIRCNKEGALVYAYKL